MISPIRATPGMQPDDIANVINNLGEQVQSENRTKVIRDETGIDRIILGMFPDGTYGFAISKKGKDVIKELSDGV